MQHNCTAGKLRRKRQSVEFDLNDFHFSDSTHFCSQKDDSNPASNAMSFCDEMILDRVGVGWGVRVG